MPDMKLCVNDQCPLKEDCARYYENSDNKGAYNQSYAEFEPYTDESENVKCEYFIDINRFKV